MGAPHPVPTEPHAEGTASFFLSPRPGQGKGLPTDPYGPPNSRGAPPLPSPCRSLAHLSSDSSRATLRKRDFCWVEAQPPLGPLSGATLSASPACRPPRLPPRGGHSHPTPTSQHPCLKCSDGPPTCHRPPLCHLREAS